MAISADLFRAILAMDVYSRGPADTNPFIDIDGNQLGDATLWDGEIYLPVNYAASSFFAQAYTYNGQTVISYRGTDDPNPLSLTADPATGYGIAAGARPMLHRYGAGQDDRVRGADRAAGVGAGVGGG